MARVGYGKRNIGGFGLDEERWDGLQLYVYGE